MMLGLLLTNPFIIGKNLFELPMNSSKPAVVTKKAKKKATKKLVKAVQLEADPTSWADRELVDKDPDVVAEKISNMESIIDKWLKSKIDPKSRKEVINLISKTPMPDGRIVPIPMGIKYV